MNLIVALYDSFSQLPLRGSLFEERNPNQNPFRNQQKRRYGQQHVHAEKGKEWELYDVVKDRTERNNLAEQHPEVLTKLVAEWEKWANSNFVLPKHPKK